MESSTIIISGLVLLTTIACTVSIPVPSNNAFSEPTRPVDSSVPETILSRQVGPIISLHAKTYNFSSMAKGFQLLLKGKQINRRNLKLTISDAMLIVELLHGQTFEERMYVWWKTAELCATSGKKGAKNHTAYDIEALDKFEGDIILNRRDVDEMFGAPIADPFKPSETRESDRATRVKRKMTSRQTRYWTGAIPWKIDDARFSPNEVDIIKSALQHWEEMTCVRFQDITDPKMSSSLAQNPPTDNNNRSRTNLGFPLGRAPPATPSDGSGSGVSKMAHLKFVRENGCYSYTGKLGDSGQDISIGPECAELGIVAHEVGHAIGFYHEHNRPDRDHYISINYDNILMDHSENFRLVGWDKVLTYGIPYDYSSLMHYKGTEWGQPEGSRTIVSKQPEMQKVMGQRERLSFKDIKLANFQFCSVACFGHPNLEWSECLHGGYRNPNACDKCLCPTGWTGPRCAEVAPAENGICGESSITATEASQILTSPAFDTSELSKEVRCAWHIKAPTGSRVKLNIEEKFDIGYEQYTCEEYVEIRYKGVNKTGTRFCSTKISTHDLMSYGDEVMVLFRGKPQRVEDNQSRRFTVTYSVAEGCGGCSPKQTAIQVPVCTREKLYDCSTQVSFACQDSKTCTENRENFCYREVPYCCPPYVLQNGNCQLQEFKAPVNNNKDVWGPWSNWSSCSATCGGCGWRSRERECLKSRCRGYSLEWERCGTSLCPVVSPTKSTCKIEEISLCPSQTGFIQCLKTRYEPCPENHHTQRCCPGFQADTTKGECIPEPTTTTGSPSGS